MCRTKKKTIRLVFLICILCLCSCKKQGTEIILENSGQESVVEETEEMQEETAKEEEKPAEPICIWVDVSGAVARPGVYKLPENARLFEAIEAAGGFLEQADKEWLNQALALKDGEKIQVYTREETEKLKAQGLTSQEGTAQQEQTSSEDQETVGKVNLNTATLEGLQEIPGIGEVRAQAILEYRQQVGRFQNIEEIQQVPGIKGKTYEKIADYICVE